MGVSAFETDVIIDVSGGDESEPEESFEETEQRSLARRNGRLRADAGLAYMSDPGCSSIEKLSQDPRFTSVSKRTLERWASEDGWVERKQAFLAKWTKAAREKIGSQIMQSRIAEMEQLLEMRDIGMSFVRDPTVRPKSWEGAVRGVLDTNGRIEGLTKELSGDLMPPGSANLKVEVDMSEGELDAAAEAILEQRRQKRLAAAHETHENTKEGGSGS